MARAERADAVAVEGAHAAAVAVIQMHLETLAADIGGAQVDAAIDAPLRVDVDEQFEIAKPLFGDEVGAKARSHGVLLGHDGAIPDHPASRGGEGALVLRAVLIGFGSAGVIRHGNARDGAPTLEGLAIEQGPEARGRIGRAERKGGQRRPRRHGFQELASGTRIHLGLGPRCPVFRVGGAGVNARRRRVLLPAGVPSAATRSTQLSTPVENSPLRRLNFPHPKIVIIA